MKANVAGGPHSGPSRRMTAAGSPAKPSRRPAFEGMQR